MDWQALLIILHVVGVAIGVGGATVSDSLFFRTIKDGKINKTEFAFLKTTSSVVWFGLIILFFSGFGLLFLSKLAVPESGLFYNPKFLAKFSIALIILFNGLVIHWKVFPFFQAHLGKTLNSPEFIKKVPFLFTSGAISTVSWYSALILGAWRTLNLPYLTIMGIYLFVLLGGVLIANIISRYFIKSLSNTGR